MSISRFKNWFALLSVMMLVACGGGSSGDSGSLVLPGTGSGGGGTGGNTGNPTVAVALSSTTVTPAAPATVTVTVRDAKGNPIAGVVVDLSMVRGEFAKLGVTSVATDANGTASTTLSALTTGVSGADEVVGVAKLGTTTVEGSGSFTVSGAQPTVGLSISSTTLRGSAGPVTLNAAVKDAAGNPVPDAVVAFTTGSGRVALGAPSAKTDRLGLASITVTVIDPTISAAEVVAASATVGATTVNSTLVLQILADVASMTVTASQSNVSPSTPVSLSVLVTDASGRPASAGTLVSISSTFGLTAFNAATALTGPTGVAQFVMTPRTAASNGADQIVAKATIGGVAVTALTVVQVSSVPSTTNVSISVSPGVITSAMPGTVSITVRDSNGNAVPGVVVDLSMVRGTLATLNVGSVATGANGGATATLTVASGARGGADQVVGTVIAGIASVQGSASFTVSGSIASVSLAASSTTLSGSTGPVTLSAQVRDASGYALQGQVVNFASVGGRVLLSAPSVVSDDSGIARVNATVANANVTAADTVTASTTIGSATVQGSVALQLKAISPELVLTASSATVSAATPVTLQIMVKDPAGNPVGAGTLVSLGSIFGLSAFDAATVVTNASGVAQAVVTPRTATSNGADQITATATVNGATVSQSTVLQVSAPANIATVAVSLDSSTVTSTTPAMVTVTVRDQRGSPIPGAVVDLTTARGTLATLRATSVVTGANGSATTTLAANGSGLVGADEVFASTRVGTATVQSSVGFAVTGGAATISLSISPTTLSGSSASATLQAVIRDAAGQVVPNLPVSFATVGGWTRLSGSSIITDASGRADVTVSVSDSSVTVADTLTANAIVNGRSLQGSVAVQLRADIPTLTLALNLPSGSVTAVTPGILTIAVVSGTGAPAPAGTVVTLASLYGLSAFDAATVATNASGVAQARITPRTNTSNGADQISATATVGGVAVTGKAVVQITQSIASSVSVSIAPDTLNAATPTAVATVTVRNARGEGVQGAVVDLSTSRGGLAALSASSVVTNASGEATVVLSALAGGATGADQVVAAIRGSAGAAQGQVGFTVAAGAGPSLALDVSPANTVSGSASTISASATVKNASGGGVPNALVTFNSVNGKIALSAPSAMTNSSGVASINISRADPSVTVADTLTASARVNGAQVQGAQVIQLLADRPSLEITASPSNLVSAAVPATLAILVRDGLNASVGAGTIVQISSLYGLSTFDATTVSTDSTGVARVTVTPKSAASNGADQVVASVTVGGVSVSKQQVVNVSSSTFSAPPLLQTALSSTSISAASPAVVTATLTDGKGQVVAGEVVTFSVVRGLAKTNIATALTDAFGRAVVVLSPSNAAVSGADQVTASTSFAGVALQSTKGFQIQATNVTLTAFESAVASLGAYGQTTLTVRLTGASASTPVNLNVSSACVSLNKATLSPSTLSATSGVVSLQYKDNGCGALQIEDKLQVVIVGSGQALPLTLPITSPAASSLAFVTATPEIIYIKGSGFTESSTLIFEVRDGAGNILPNRSVTLSLLTRSGGVTMEGGTVDVTQVSDASGRVSVRVNAGTIPTPVRVSAKLTDVPSIATVSSNLSVAVGLPSQLNFSLSQQTRNIEGMNIDGTPNTYNIIASDRSGNPVPAGTSINFITEGGQVESIKQTQLVAGIARTSAAFVSADPRPADGRVTVTAYALGEESFIDQNGNNAYDPGEPFQDLGNLFKDRIFNGTYESLLDEFIPTNIANLSACLLPINSGGVVRAVTPVEAALLAFDASVPSVGGMTCSGDWSGAGRVYVRRAIETVLSTSAARALWSSTAGLSSSCSSLTLQTGPEPTTSSAFTPVQNGETWYAGSGGAFLPFIVGDNNRFPSPGPGGTVGRLNPMAAGTTVTASTPSTGLTVRVGGGTPVPSTTEATTAVIGLNFESTSAGVVFVTFTSPSGVASTYTINVRNTVAPSSCP